MKQSRKEFIKQGHAAACTEWKLKIENEYPKLFKKTELEVGKWYSSKDCGFLYCLTGFNHATDSTLGYGFDKRKWCDADGNGWEFKDDKNIKPATDKEVEEALIKESKKRGFNFNVCFHFEGRNEKVGSGGFIYQDGVLYVTGWGKDAIFSKGKWATIINTITKEEAEKELGKTIID